MSTLGKGRAGRGEAGRPDRPLWEEDWLIWLTAACVGLPLSVMMWLAIDAGWHLRAVAASPFLVSLVAGYLIRALGRFVER